MATLNENEVKALVAICNDCDEIEGEGFTRIGHMINALMGAFGNYQKVGGYIADLMEKDCIIVDAREDEVWVPRETYATYC